MLFERHGKKLGTCRVCNNSIIEDLVGDDLGKAYLENRQGYHMECAETEVEPEPTHPSDDEIKRE
jgi:hypothetical protein